MRRCAGQAGGEEGCPEKGGKTLCPVWRKEKRKKKAEVFIKLPSLLSWNNYSTPLSPAAAGAAVSEEQGLRARRRRRQEGD